jgi:hypothetical protein
VAVTYRLRSPAAVAAAPQTRKAVAAIVLVRECAAVDRPPSQRCRSSAQAQTGRHRGGRSKARPLQTKDGAVVESGSLPAKDRKDGVSLNQAEINLCLCMRRLPQEGNLHSCTQLRRWTFLSLQLSTVPIPKPAAVLLEGLVFSGL